jgi:hypothetical protein
LNALTNQDAGLDEAGNDDGYPERNPGISAQGRAAVMRLLGDWAAGVGRRVSTVRACGNDMPLPTEDRAWCRGMGEDDAPP